MPLPRRPLPPSLVRGTFTVAQAVEADVPEHRLRSGDLHRPTKGVRSHREATTLDDLAADLGLALPAPWAWSHLTAARLFRLPLPSEWTRAEPLHVLRPTDCAQVRRPGLVGHRGLEHRETLTLRGHPTTTAAWTWVDLASLRELSVTDLVIAGDAFATRDPALFRSWSRWVARAGRVVVLGSSGPLRSCCARAAVRRWRPGGGWPSSTPGFPSPS